MSDLVELDDVGMVEQLEYLHLAVDFAQIVVVQSRLVDNLDRNLHATVARNRRTTVNDSLGDRSRMHDVGNPVPCALCAPFSGQHYRTHIGLQ